MPSAPSPCTPHQDEALASLQRIAFAPVLFIVRLRRGGLRGSGIRHGLPLLADTLVEIAR